jgi:predicted nuclease with TOPRIM domain
MPGESLLQTLQKIATIVHRIDTLTEEVRELRTSTTGRFERLEAQMGDMRERLARLEASRAADRSQMEADLSRFRTEVERAELRLERLQATEHRAAALPEPRDAAD